MIMIIDATDLIVGRLASTVAKRALLGEKIDIVNAERAVITGDRTHVLNEYKRRRDMGTWAKGPFFYRSADRLLRRSIRGMLPYKQEKGKKAYKRIMCWKGVPEPFANQKVESVKEAHISKVPNLRYVPLREVVKFLGGKSE
ncbi:50S ribosomal protein L13 [Candidatus Woesearchaeota archaeon]|nr:50S ribosomal protein L13 [Candidatus Woesearchaeota archaeon]